jgi:hypothetical protein
MDTKLGADQDRVLNPVSQQLAIHALHRKIGGSEYKAGIFLTHMGEIPTLRRERGPSFHLSNRAPARLPLPGLLVPIRIGTRDPQGGWR